MRPVHEPFYRVSLRREERRGFDAYRDDPVGFARDVLRMRTWPRMEEILTSAAKSDRVSVRAGRRVSKTESGAAIVHWFVQTRGPGARVILTSPTATNLNKGLWRAVRMAYQRVAGELGGKCGVKAETGIRWTDSREVVGITADQAEAFQGLAGAEMLFVVDEASGVDERIFEALMGNLAGGAKLVLLANPTQDEGFFFDSHKSSSRYVRIHIKSTESPNITETDPAKWIKGLATEEWREEMAHLYGIDGMLYRVHVLGEFVTARTGRMFTPAMLERASLAWAAADEDTGRLKVPPTGRLYIGIDPAGEGGDGDASGFAWRRGLRVIDVGTRRGLTPDAHLVEVLGLIGQHRGDSTDKPVVLVDQGGIVGHRVFVVLNGYLQTHPEAFELRGIQGHQNAVRRAHEIDKVRDELWFALVDAFHAGLAIPSSLELAGDLGAIRFDKLINGRAKVLGKREIRRELGRSPDLGDALTLCCYEGMGREESPAPDLPEDDERTGREEGGALDPYAGLAAFSGGRALDPYR